MPRRALRATAAATSPPQGARSHSLLAAVETAVWQALRLRATLTDTSTVLDDIKALVDASAQAAQAEAELRMTERAVAEIDAQRDALLDLQLAKRLDANRFSAKDAALLGQQQALIDQHGVLATRHNAALAQQLPIAEIENLGRLGEEEVGPVGAGPARQPYT